MRSKSEPAFEICTVSKLCEHIQIMRPQSDLQVYTASGVHAAFEHMTDIFDMLPYVIAEKVVEEAFDHFFSYLYHVVPAVANRSLLTKDNTRMTWQVILEASTDLVNWTPVAPGDYPSASPQRFFRTRLVKRP